MAKSVRRDLHKMHAFVRFRRIDDPTDGERFVAWFEPEHFILEATAPTSSSTASAACDWTILTPHRPPALGPRAPELRPAGPARGCAGRRPVRGRLAGLLREHLQPGAREPRPPPAAEMPKKYWKNLPEAAAIPEMVRTAPSRVQRDDRTGGRHADTTHARESAVAAMADQAPKSLEALNRLIAAAEPMVEGGTAPCWARARSAPPSPSSASSRATRRTSQGRPFVGPAGQLFDRRWPRPGIDRGEVYVTNAVKHFKYDQRGKRRLHQSPTAGEVKHYRWWLKKELDFVAAPARRRPRRHRAARAGRQGAAGDREPRRAPRSTAASATSPCIPPTCCACPTRRRSGRSGRPTSPTCGGFREIAA